MLPPTRDEQKALAACALLARAERDDTVAQKLLPAFSTGLLLARSSGQPTSSADVQTHRKWASDFFACETLRHGLIRLLPRAAEQDIDSAAPHVDVARFDPIRVTAVRTLFTTVASGLRDAAARSGLPQPSA